ncbi:MAG: hypothetical protein U0359_22175 [Byssovorax sp.]
MALDLKTLKKYYNRCDPFEELEPSDDRNVDLDERTPDGHYVRGVRWVDRLARQVILADRPVQCMFSGLPGSGKSTELLRLAAQLKDAGGSNFLTVIANAEELIDLADEVDVPDILIALLYETERQVLVAEGREPADALRDGPMRRLWTWLSRTDVTLTGAEFGLGGDDASAKLALELKTRQTVRQKIRAVVSAHLRQFVAEVQTEFMSLEKRAKALGRARLVVILDSLEKLQGMSTNFPNVLASAEAVFANGAPYLQLPVHVIYTIPPALIARLRFDSLWFMPMVKLKDRDGKTFEPGYGAALQLIEKRVPRPILNEILGPTTMADRLRRMIEWSGGYPREIVRLLRSLIEEALDGSISEQSFRRTLQMHSDAIRRTVPDYAFPWLAEVEASKRLPLDSEEQREIVSRMLQNNLVMCYLNDEEWFDLHPVVSTMPAMQPAIEKAKKRT